MGKSAKAKQQVDEFYMSIHLGLCHGPVDAITGLYVGEKLAWEGEITSEAAVLVDSPSLFGGPKDEGGVGGVMYVLMGSRNQVMPNDLAARMGLTSATCPAYRGVASVFFIGTEGVPIGSIDVSGNTGGDGTGNYTSGGSEPTGASYTGSSSYPVGGDGNDRSQQFNGPNPIP